MVDVNSRVRFWNSDGTGEWSTLAAAGYSNYTFDSGLTLTGTNVRWNGDLLENVLIGGQETYQLNFGLLGNSISGFGVWSNNDIYLYLDAPFNNTGILLEQSTQDVLVYSQNNISLSNVGDILMNPAGSVLVNTALSSGFNFEVNGTAKIGSDLEIDGVLRETVTFNTQTVTPYTLILQDRGKMIRMNNGGPNIILIPSNGSVPFPIGTKIDIIQIGAGQTSIVADVGVLLDSAGALNNLTNQYSAATLIKHGTDEWYLIGDLS